GFGCALPMRRRRSQYQFQTKFGSRANASGVASFVGSRFRRYPSLPRKVGIPLSAETPAPVITRTRMQILALACSGQPPLPITWHLLLITLPPTPIRFAALCFVPPATSVAP